MTDTPSARELILHIGMEKCGTSTLQQVLTTNREALRQAGLLYPASAGLPSSSQIGHLARHLRDEVGGRGRAAAAPLDREALMAALRQEIAASGCPRVLLSHEHFSARLKDEATIRALIGTLRPLAERVRVIVFLRAQYELFPSSYSTRVKGGQLEPEQVPESPGNLYYNINKMLKRWEAAVGIENMTVRRFGRAWFTGGDLVATFFEAIGMAMPAGLVIGRERNKSLDGQTLEFLRLANAHLGPEDGQDGNRLRIWLLEALQSVTGRGGPVASPEQLAEIDRLFLASNRRVAARYFKGERRLFPAYDPEGRPEVMPLTVERAVAIGMAMIRLAYSGELEAPPAGPARAAATLAPGAAPETGPHAAL